MMPVLDYEIELNGGTTLVPCGGFNYFTVQIVPRDYGSTTGVINIEKSISGQEADAVAFSTPITPNMTTKAIDGPNACHDVPYLHIVNSTADAGKNCTVHVFLSNADRGGDT